ncbi:MAG: 3-hydroxyacyl-CoA dehydrogenase family protein [Candidatus Bathyarchaeia archaeon]
MKPVDDIEKIAVIGAGVMGHGIAEVYALNGYDVCLMDVTDSTLERAIRMIGAELKTMLRARLISKRKSQAALKRLSTTTSLQEAAECCDFVTEAVAEDLTLKKQTFANLERYAGDDVILASNTSGLMISTISEGLRRPERVIGTHFSVPPHIVPGVEIIRGRETSDRTFQIAYDLIKNIGKVPFVVKREIEGYILNRLQFALAREAFNLVEKGVATPEDVDICLNSVLGFRWATVGPFRQIDSAGIDTWAKVGGYLFASLSNSPEVPKAIIEKVAKGELGMKTRKGFYDYTQFGLEDVTRERDEGFIKTLKLMRTLWKQDIGQIAKKNIRLIGEDPS